MTMYVLPIEDVDLMNKLRTERKLTNVQHETLLATRMVDAPSYKTLAQHLGMPVGTVKSRINRVRLILEKHRPQQLAPFVLSEAS